MRDIKFRAMRKDGFGFAFGNLVQDVYDKVFIETREGTHMYTVKVDGDTVGQYTGMKDVDGNDIYEGDILTFEPYEWNRGSFKPKEEWEYPTWVVSWNEREAAWNLGGGTSSETHAYKKVIGNIHQKGWEKWVERKAKQAIF